MYSQAYKDPEEAETRSPSSVRRGGTSPSLRLQARQAIKDMGGPIVQRRSRLPQQARSTAYQEPETQPRRTEDDEALRESTRRPWRARWKPVNEYDDPDLYCDHSAGRQSYRKGSNSHRATDISRRRGWHPLFWLAIGAFILLFVWQLTTSGAAWWSTHVTDPSQYGPTRGNIITAVLGRGDSAASPSKILAFNNNGQVQLLILMGNSPAKAHMITGPDLAVLNFPDPKQAVIQIQAGDFNGDRKTDLKIIVWADSYVMPFHRYSMSFLLTGDGKGSFQQVQA